MPTDTVRAVMNVWWWASVPYSLLFLASVQLFHLSPGYLAHVLFPLTILFWVALFSSTAWTLVSLIALTIRRLNPITVINKVMVLLGMVASYFGIQAILS